MSDTLQTTVRELPNATIVDLVGEVTSFTAVQLHAVFETVSGRGVPYIIFNFAGVEYINSAGLATVIGILSVARQRGQKVLLVGLNDHYRKVFRMVGVARYAEILDDEAQALDRIAAAV